MALMFASLVALPAYRLVRWASLVVTVVLLSGCVPTPPPRPVTVRPVTAPVVRPVVPPVVYPARSPAPSSPYQPGGLGGRTSAPALGLNPTARSNPAGKPLLGTNPS